MQQVGAGSAEPERGAAFPPEPRAAAERSARGVRRGAGRARARRQAGAGGEGGSGPVSSELSAAREAGAGGRGEGDAKAAGVSAASRSLRRHLPCGAAPVGREGKGLRACGGATRGAARPRAA